MKQADVMRGLAAAWGKLSETAKKPYLKMHEADVKRYEKEKKDLATKGYFINKEGQDSRTLGKKNAAKDAAVQPKRALSAYLFFSIENLKNLRAKNPAISMCECTKHSAQAWSELSDAKKAKFNTMHEKDLAREKKERQQLETKGYFINKDGVKSTDMVAKKFKYPPGTKMPKRPPSAYFFYLEANLETICEKQNVNKTQGKEVCEKVWEKLNPKQ